MAFSLTRIMHFFNISSPNLINKYVILEMCKIAVSTAILLVKVRLLGWRRLVALIIVIRQHARIIH